MYPHIPYGSLMLCVCIPTKGLKTGADESNRRELASFCVCRSICIQDLRTGCSGRNGGEPSVRIAEAHAGSVNCVEWNPFDENLLLSTGLDNAIQVLAKCLLNLVIRFAWLGT